MTSKELTKLKDKLRKAFQSFGRSGSTAPPPSQDKLDDLLHMLYIDRYAASAFDKRKKETIEKIAHAMGAAAAEQIIKLKVAAIRDLSPQAAIIASGQHYALQYTAGTPAHRFKKDKLGSYLSKLGWSHKEIQALIASCSEYDEPSSSYEAIQLLE